MSNRSEQKMNDCIPFLTMLGDENRQKIMFILTDEDELTVTQLTERLTLSRPAVSHHLKLLHDTNLVSVRKAANERYYRFNLEYVRDTLMGMLETVNEQIEKRNKRNNKE